MWPSARRSGGFDHCRRAILWDGSGHSEYLDALSSDLLSWCVDLALIFCCFFSLPPHDRDVDVHAFIALRARPGNLADVVPWGSTCRRSCVGFIALRASRPPKKKKKRKGKPPGFFFFGGVFPQNPPQWGPLIPPPILPGSSPLEAQDRAKAAALHKKELYAAIMVGAVEPRTPQDDDRRAIMAA